MRKKGMGGLFTFLASFALIIGSTGMGKPTPKKESPARQLLRKLNGMWRDTDGIGLTLEIRRNLETGGMIYYWHRDNYLGKKSDYLVEQSPYKVTGRDTIKDLKSGYSYRVRFNRKGMDWSDPKKPSIIRHFQRLHPKA